MIKVTFCDAHLQNFPLMQNSCLYKKFEVKKHFFSKLVTERKSNEYDWLTVQPQKQTCTLPRPDSNPGQPRELVQNRVAMSRCTNWPPKMSTNMVIDHCTINIQTCMIPFCVRSNVLIKIMYHTCMFVIWKLTYDHICTQFWKSILHVRLQSYQIFSNIEKVKYLF